MLSDHELQVKWTIADGYYMYRDKASNKFSGDGIITKTPELPKGGIKSDPLFGEVAVYTQGYSVNIPIALNGATTFTLIAKGQGCNEPIGICYPPITHKIKFTAMGGESPGNEQQNLFNNWNDSASSNSSPLNNSEIDSANDLRNLLAAGFEQQTFLDVNEAFKLQIIAEQSNQLSAVFEIAEGYYLYRDKIQIESEPLSKIQRVELPLGKIKHDEYFGEVTVFTDSFSVPVILEDHENIFNSLVVNANYQGCAEDGICYSPVYKSFDLSKINASTSDSNEFGSSMEFTQEKLETIAGAFAQTSQGFDLENADKPSSASSNPNIAYAQFVDSGAIWTLLLGALIAGLLLTFTPCVLPLIPILSSVIAGQGDQLTRRRGGMLAAVYVLGTMVTYATMGALAGASGDQLQAYFQNIWAIGLLSGLFFVMALSMFGLFEIQAPSFAQSWLQDKTRNLGGAFSLVFLLGLFSALIVGACVSPVLISFLGIAITSGNPVLGAQLMLAMALGMGIPLIALGFGAGHFIPRAGQWMEKVKQGFGVMLISVALYLLGALPQVPVLFLWGGFFIILSRFLGKSEDTSNANWQQLEKGLGIILLVWGIILIAGGFMGQRDIFKPIPTHLFSTLSNNTNSVELTTHEFTRVHNLEQLEQHLTTARSSEKSVLIDYYADWCVDCVRMEKTTFTDARVKAKLEENYITLQVDVTDPTDPNNKALKQRFNVFGPPATIFLNRDGEPENNKNFYGYMDNTQFLELISDN